MTIPLTPIEEEALAGLRRQGGGSQEEWKRRIEHEKNENKRVELAVGLKAVLDAGHGGALKGAASMKDLMERLRSLRAVSALPKKARPSKAKAQELFAAADHAKRSAAMVLGEVRKIVPVKKLHAQGREALGDVNYLRTLFGHHQETASNAANRGIVKKVHKAFLEGGKGDVQRLAKREFSLRALPHEGTRAFANRIVHVVITGREPPEAPRFGLERKALEVEHISRKPTPFKMSRGRRPL